MAPVDPHDVAGLLGRLTRRLTHSLADLEPGDWRCLRVLPRIDGTAAVVLRCADRELTLNWVAPPQVDADWHWGRLDADGAELPGAQAADVLQRLAHCLQDSLDHPAYGVLRWVNLRLTELRFDDQVVDRLLAGRLGPDRTRWYEHRFRDAFQPATDAFQLTFDSGAGELVFRVTAPGVRPSGAERLLVQPVFSLWLETDPRPPEARTQVRQQVERFLGFLLSRGVHSGLRVASGSVASPTDDGAPTVSWRGAPVSTSRWGNPLQWHQFFSDFEIARSELCNVQLVEPVAHVIHGEPECCVVEPCIRGGAHSYARSPFRPGARDRHTAPPPSPRLFLSLITERETVLGGDAALDEALDRAARDPDTRLVHINNTCLPKMVGDDLDSLVARLAERTDKGVLNLNTDLASPEASHRHMLAQAEKHAQQRDADDGVGPRAVSFFGYHRSSAHRELLALLAACEVEVAAFLVPQMSVREAARYRRGCAQVVYPRAEWRRLRDELFADLDTPVLDAPAPYGLTDTRRWLAAIARAVSPSVDLARRWDELVGPHQDRFHHLREAARDLRVGVVVTRESAHRLVDATAHYGVALLPLLEELGFGLDVLLLEPDVPDELAAIEGTLREALREPVRLAVHRFSSPETLATQLADLPGSLVYSEVACDHRLSRAGKTGFGLDVFEMGLAGAVRSLERLLHRARWPLRHRYAAYLGRRPELPELDDA